MKKSFYKNKIKKSIDKKKQKIKRLFKTKGWIAHHGLERSGTNYLRACLISIEVDLINQFDPKENNPKHKHFRWYEGKYLIPRFRKQFANNLYVKNIYEINNICGYPAETNHLVIKKSYLAALTSIANYSFNEKWFSNKDEVKKNLNLIYKDYEAYYNFWQTISDKNPSQVQIIMYEDLLLSSTPLINALKKLDINPKIEIPNQFFFDELHQSNKDRKKVFSEKEILKSFIVE